jgi:flagellar biogenesis protein FliO
MFKAWLQGMKISGYALCGVIGLGWQAWGDEGDGVLWGNSVTANLDNAHAAAPETHVGQVILALLMVLGLIALIVWCLRQWHRPQVPEAGDAGRVLVFNQINAAQTFMLWETQGKIYAVIMKNKKTEMLTELAGMTMGVQTPEGKKGPGTPKTFQDIWLALLKTGKHSR